MSGKGGAWERDVCKYLSKWINGTETPYIFWRGSGSGGVFTRNNLVGERFAGDIYPVREEGKFLTNMFVIECKNGYKEASLDKHLKNNKNDGLRDFWQQAVEQAVNTDKLPMLIFKKKGMPTPWLGICHSTRQKLETHLSKIRFVHIGWNNDLIDCYFYSYKEFFDIIEPNIIKEMI